MNKQEIYGLIKQFIKFGIVGVSNTLLSLAIYYTLVHLRVYYVIANTVGFVLSVLNAYYWNNKHVFEKSQQGHLKPLMKAYVSYGMTFLLSTVLLILMVDFIGISELIAPLLILMVTIPLNFILNKYWAFK